MARMGLSLSDRSEISAESKARRSVWEIASHLGRHSSVIFREVRRNPMKTRGYQAACTDARASKHRRRPQERGFARDGMLRAEVRADLGESRTLNEIAGWLRTEATDPIVERMANSIDAQNRTVGGKAIDQYGYAQSRGALAKHGIMPQSKNTRRLPRSSGRSLNGPIIAMTPASQRGEGTAQRRVPKRWEAGLFIGKNDTSRAAV